MHQFFKYLNLDKVGFLEIILALYPIMAAYRYGALYLSHIVLIAIDIILLLNNKRRLLKFSPLIIFLIYYVVHQIIGITVFGLTQSYYLNSIVGSLIFLSSLFIIIPYIDFEKFEGSINWISIICLIGLLYHAFLVFQGVSISTIKLPFLPTPEQSQTRLYEVGVRPQSFFMEPQSYVSYMLFTLFFAVRNRKYLWAVLVGLSIILSTSTTGLAMIPIMILLFLIAGKSKWYSKALMAIILGGLAFFLFNSSLATLGLEKMMNTELSLNIRTNNGPALARLMDMDDIIIGVPYSDATDFYLNSTSAFKNQVIVDNRGGVFIPGFWQVLIFFGIVGVVLYFLIFWGIWKKSKETLPLIGALVVALFSNPDFIGAGWCFQIMYLMSFANRNDRIIVINSNIRQMLKFYKKL